MQLRLLLEDPVMNPVGESMSGEYERTQIGESMRGANKGGCPKPGQQEEVPVRENFSNGEPRTHWYDGRG